MRSSSQAQSSRPTSRTRALEVLRDLIQIRTENPPGNELAAAQYVADRLSRVGVKAEIDQFAAHRANVCASIHGAGPGPTVLLTGHLDVVPAGDGWTFDPYCAETRGGMVYGRGAADMKSGLAAMMVAASQLSETRNEWSGCLKIAFVADEERSNLGTMRYLSNGNTADYAILGEPTGLRVAIGHRGVARIKIVVHGEPWHACQPDNGTNAIYHSLGIVDAVRRRHANLAEDRHPLLGAATVAVTTFHAGIADNTIPGSSELMVNRRTLPGETASSVVSDLTQWLEETGAVDEISWDISVESFLPACALDRSSRLVKEAVGVVADHRGEEPSGIAFKATCEQALFVKAGIETVILGPGHLECAHRADEAVPVQELQSAMQIYRAIVESLLCRGEDSR